MNDLIIRKGVESDIPSVHALIMELAEFEHGADRVELTVDQLRQDGFGTHPVFEFYVAAHRQKIVGLSLFYYRYSTWKGKGVYLEDLIVTESHRGQGIGKKLLVETAKFAKEHYCTGLYWQVLDWNSPAIEFYKSLGATFDEEWINCKFDQNAMNNIV